MTCVFPRINHWGCGIRFKRASAASVILVLHQVERLEFGQVYQVIQPRVGDIGISRLSDWSSGHPREVFQSRVSHTGSPQVQRLQLGPVSQMGQAGVRDLVAVEEEALELVHSVEAVRPRVRHFGLAQVQPAELRAGLQVRNPVSLICVPKTFNVCSLVNALAFPSRRRLST